MKLCAMKVSLVTICEFFPFIISIENGNVQYHSNHTGSAGGRSAAIYSREISRERSRVTLLYQRLIANMVSCLFDSNL